METRRPGGLTAIAIIGIVLGSLGACGGLFGLGGALMSSRFESMQREMLEGTSPPGQLEAQRQMQDEMSAINRKWMPFTGTHQALNLVASMVLLGASVLLLRGTPRGAGLFVTAAVASLLVDLAGAILGVAVQRDTSEVMQRFFDTAAAAGTSPADMDRMFDGMMQATTWVSMCFVVGWLFVKAVYYVWGILYLRKPAARAYLTAGTP